MIQDEELDAEDIFDGLGSEFTMAQVQAALDAIEVRGEARKTHTRDKQGRSVQRLYRRRNA